MRRPKGPEHHRARARQPPQAKVPERRRAGPEGPGSRSGSAAGPRWPWRCSWRWPRRRGGAYTPPVGSKELKDVLYNWTWHMGMLRSGAESELIKTLDYYGASGTIQVNGQPCTLTKYHLQANYQIPGYRIEHRVHARQTSRPTRSSRT